jgi:3-phenylpropionate/trans-cinnamate dioxygenase ferredoxin reductase subunit
MDYQYLIIGGGMTADSAVRGIRKNDSIGSIGLISAESDPPYDRPPLSKGLWKGKPIKEIWRNTQEMNVDLYLGRRVTALDLKEKHARDDAGNEYGFGKLLFATGGSPRQLPFGEGLILYYRELRHYRELHQLAQSKQKFAVIGGGFIGSELAAALAMNERKVTMIFPERGIGSRQFPDDLSQFLNDYYQAKGVEILSEAFVSDVEKSGEHVIMHTKQDQHIKADAVVAGIGIRPNIELARSVGLEVEDGIVADMSLRTSHPDVYAAGDVASFYNPALDKRIRVEHEDNANTMGEMAGRSMAGETIRYDHLPYFYSDLFDLGYEAVGELNPSLETVAYWQEPFQKGAVYYRDNERIRGVLLWNLWGLVDRARELIAARSTVAEEVLRRIALGEEK